MIKDITGEGSGTARSSVLDRALYLANGALAALLLGLFLVYVLALLFRKEQAGLENGALVSAAFLPPGAAFALAARQFRHHLPKRWLAQVLPLLLLVVSFFVLALLYQQVAMSACDANHGVCL